MPISTSTKLPHICLHCCPQIHVHTVLLKSMPTLFLSNACLQCSLKSKSELFPSSLCSHCHLRSMFALFPSNLCPHYSPKLDIHNDLSYHCPLPLKSMSTLLPLNLYPQRSLKNLCPLPLKSMFKMFSQIYVRTVPSELMSTLSPQMNARTNFLQIFPSNLLPQHSHISMSELTPPSLSALVSSNLCLKYFSQVYVHTVPPKTVSA